MVGSDAQMPIAKQARQSALWWLMFSVRCKKGQQYENMQVVAQRQLRAACVVADVPGTLQAL